MATTTRGSQRKGGGRAPAARTAPLPATSAAAPMTAAEAAPPLDNARDATAIAAATLLPATAPLPATEMSPAPVTPATPSPNPDAVADADPLPADNAATPAATKDSSMDMNATIENATDTATDKGQAMFADVSERTKGAVEKSQKLLAELADFNKGTLEAVVESSKIAARGFETMGQDAAAYAKSSFEGATQTMKSLATVKSPTEFLRLQADYARTAFDALVAQASRSTEASLKLAGEVAQPISNRVALAAEKIKIAA